MMKTVGEALALILEAVAPCGEERVALLDALGLVSASTLIARRELPPFDNSAMDGYAVRASDVAGASDERAVALPVRGESRAGGPMPGALEPGTAMRIFTGAPMPSEADAVVAADLQHQVPGVRGLGQDHHVAEVDQLAELRHGDRAAGGLGVDEGAADDQARRARQRVAEEAPPREPGLLAGLRGSARRDPRLGGVQRHRQSVFRYSMMAFCSLSVSIAENACPSLPCPYMWVL